MSSWYTSSSEEEPQLNIEELTNPNSEQKILQKNQKNNQNRMTSGAAKSEDYRDGLTEDDVENIEEDQEEDQEERQKQATKALDKTLSSTLSDIDRAKQEGNLSAVIEYVNNAILPYLAYTPTEYKNNVISSVADQVVDMKDNGRRIFKDKEQVLTFLNGILSGSLHRQPRKVKETIKNDNLTKNKILNPKLMNYKPKPFTSKHNYVYKGNSRKTVI